MGFKTDKTKVHRPGGYPLKLTCKRRHFSKVAINNYTAILAHPLCKLPVRFIFIR